MRHPTRIWKYTRLKYAQSDKWGTSPKKRAEWCLRMAITVFVFFLFSASKEFSLSANASCKHHLKLVRSTRESHSRERMESARKSNRHINFWRHSQSGAENWNIFFNWESFLFGGYAVECVDYSPNIPTMRALITSHSTFSIVRA